MVTLLTSQICDMSVPRVSHQLVSLTSLFTAHSIAATMMIKRACAFALSPPRCHGSTKTKQYAFVDNAELLVATSLSTADVTPIQEFEPRLNVPALTSFVIISIVFGLLQQRINSVSTAAKRRSEALESLRKVESLQLSVSDKDRPTEADVVQAKAAYESALKNELSLRTVIPGVRIVAPNDPKREEEERAAAKRFLGWNDEDFGDLGMDENDSNLSVRAQSIDPQQKEAEGLSAGANVLLLLVATMLITLLWTLSLDPMTADKVLTAADQTIIS